MPDEKFENGDKTNLFSFYRTLSTFLSSALDIPFVYFNFQCLHCACVFGFQVCKKVIGSIAFAPADQNVFFYIESYDS